MYDLPKVATICKLLKPYLYQRCDSYELKEPKTHNTHKVLFITIHTEDSKLSKYVLTLCQGKQGAFVTDGGIFKEYMPWLASIIGLANKIIHVNPRCHTSFVMGSKSQNYSLIVKIHQLSDIADAINDFSVFLTSMIAPDNDTGDEKDL